MYADRPFRRGEEVLTFRGPRLSPGEISDFTYTIQVGADAFLGSSGRIDDYVNHSCAPSCAVRLLAGELRLLAVRALQRGDEVTFDYSTCLVDEPPPVERCHCGAPTCRGRVLAFRDLDPAQRRRLRTLGRVPDFVWRSAQDVPSVTVTPP